MSDLGRVVMVVPTYNEAQNLAWIVGRLRTAQPDVDVLVVDDGSPDGTGAIADDLAAVDRVIRARLQSDVALVNTVSTYIVEAGGKRLRPLLTVAAARLAGAKDQACLKLAAAVEFIHSATLLHDDVVDGSQMRRGKVAAHLIWGAASSVLVGDYLFARAFELTAKSASASSAARHGEAGNCASASFAASA